MRIIIIGLLLSFGINCMSQSFDKISKKISRQQAVIGIRKKSKTDCFYDIREKLYEIGKLNFINKSDTLFFIESVGIENGDFYGKIWNSYGKVEYIYNNGAFKFDVNNVYTDYMCKLTQNWDTTSIRQEEKINSNMTNPRTINSTRVIKAKDNLKIDCIAFKEFFLIDRDR